MPIKTIREFIKLESASGIVLVVAAFSAILISNSPLDVYYDHLFDVVFSVKLGALGLSKPLILWINDGLMTIFFLLVGLEIKRELLAGELDSPAKISLPLLAAIGGMAAPALIYFFVNQSDPIAVRGWAIPTATDIAFSLGILALLGSRVPTTLKIFLTAIAIFDDIGAIAIIAAFYTANIVGASLIGALLCIVALFIINRLKVTSLVPYILIGNILWVFVLKSGVHATLAGVIIAFAIPLGPRPDTGESVLKTLEHKLHPWVAYCVLPLFAFANAGISFSDIKITEIFSPIMVGISLGLILGKTFGIFSITWIAVKLNIAPRPLGTSWYQIFGMSVICGVGFTMSFFVGSLAFGEAEGALRTGVKSGVFIGSLVSGLLGYLLLRLAPKQHNPYTNEENAPS